MGFVHLVTIEKTSDFQQKPRGSQHMSSLLKIFFAVSGKRKYFCCRPKQFTVSDTSCSLFIFWINNFLFSNDLSTRKEKKNPHNQAYRCVD